MAAVLVAKGLYMGGQEALQQLEEIRITHVMSVVNYHVPPPPDLDHMHVDLADEETANLLEKLPEALGWLEGALRQKGTRVLVHCHAGTSRSAAVVAAMIMKAKQLEPYEALVILRRAAPWAAPNPGFRDQLGVWADMGWRLDERHPSYKAFMLEQVARQYEEEGYVDPCTFAELPPSDDTTAGTRYRCRKCRAVVAADSNAVPPGAGRGRRAFRGQPFRAKAAAGGEGEEQEQQQQQQPQQAQQQQQQQFVGDRDPSVFLEPMAWMEGAIVGPTQGKLYCPGCGARLGSFNWAGITNTAGAWITPAFQLHLSRLDEERPRGAGGSGGGGAPAGLRLPALLAERRLQAAAEAGDLLSDLSLADTSSPSDGAPAATATANPADSAAAAASPSNGSGNGGLVFDKSSGTNDSSSSSPYFQYLVFDCDGVLVDTERASCESLRRAILEVTGFDIPHEFPLDYRGVFGMDVVGCIRHYKRVHGRDDWTDESAIAARVSAVKEAFYEELTAGGIAAFEGAAALIKEAKALGMGVAVASSGAPSKIFRNLTSSGLAPLLDPDLIVSAAYVARGKPFPDVYIEALNRLGATTPATARRALVIEDAVHGLNAGRAAGAFTIGVCSSLPEEDLSPHADCVVGKLSDLVGRLAAVRPAGAAAAAAAAAAAVDAAVDAADGAGAVNSGSAAESEKSSAELVGAAMR